MSAAKGLREADGGKNDNDVWRVAENWITEVAFNGWIDAQGYYIAIYGWQYMKYLPISGESFSRDALNAGLDGHKRAKANQNGKDDLKKWCKDCDQH